MYRPRFLDGAIAGVLLSATVVLVVGLSSCQQRPPSSASAQVVTVNPSDGDEVRHTHLNGPTGYDVSLDRWEFENGVVCVTFSAGYAKGIVVGGIDCVVVPTTEGGG